MEPIIDLLDAEWTALAELGAALRADEWATPTELPGWTVQDCYSHVVGIEHELLGRPAPPALDMTEFPHLTALSSAVTEPAVHLRRGRPPADVLEELREATAQRLEQLRALDEDQWNEPGPTPVGTVPYREFMEVRTFDCWMHEQDVRRAVDRPGHQDGPVAEHAVGRCSKALGFVVGKKAGAPDGSTVVFDLQGPITREIAVAVREGRAKLVDAAPDTPTVRLTMAPETLWCLGGGRWDPEAVLADGRVTIVGDRPLGEAVVRASNFMI